MLALVNKACYRAFALSMMLGVVVLMLAPLHRAGNHFENLTEVRADDTVVFQAGAERGLAVGDTLQLFRFNPGWTDPIGQIELVERRDEQWVARFDPARFAWPVGRQGTVDRVDGPTVELNVGSAIGVTPGVRLFLYDERVQVGQMEVTSARADRATGTILRLEPDTPVLGLTATEFIIVNQVGWFHAPWLDVVDAVAVGATILLFLWSLVDPRPGAWFFAAGARFRRWLAATGPRVRLAWSGLVGAAVVYYGGQLAWYSLTRLAAAASEWAVWLGVAETSWPWFPDYGALWGVAALGVVWGVRFFRTDAPLLTLWRWTAFRPPTFAWLKGIPRGWINWALHLVVFYAFAGTLFGFLLGNLTAIGHIGWAGHGLSFHSVPDFFRSFGTMLTVLPSPDGPRQVYQLVRVSLMTLCIAGCLYGYCHTVVSVLWKPEGIRNVDFTPWGWLFNGACYGPLLHGAVLLVSAHPTGLEPAVTDGVFYWVAQTVEQLLNLVYTLSILNLGAMFGVMVDKGVRRSGFYSVIRHPSYTVEPLLFLVLHIGKLNSPAAWLGHMIWPLKYFFRSERDDLFMGESNPEYVEYREETPYKYIPGWY